VIVNIYWLLHSLLRNFFVILKKLP
jgi:hypothetical protein